MIMPPARTNQKKVPDETDSDLDEHQRLDDDKPNVAPARKRRRDDKDTLSQKDAESVPTSGRMLRSQSWKANTVAESQLVQTPRSAGNNTRRSRETEQSDAASSNGNQETPPRTAVSTTTPKPVTR